MLRPQNPTSPPRVTRANRSKSRPAFHDEMTAPPPFGNAPLQSRTSSRTPLYPHRNLAPTRPPAYTHWRDDKGINSHLPVPSSTPPWPMSRAKLSSRPSISDLPPDRACPTHHDHFAAEPRAVGRSPIAGRTEPALDRARTASVDPHGTYCIPRGRSSDSNLRQPDNRYCVDPTTVSVPVPAAPPYRDEMVYSRAGQPASERRANESNSFPLKEISTSCMSDPVSDETLQRKRKWRTSQEPVTRPDDWPSRKKQKLMDRSLTPSLKRRPPEFVPSHHPASPPIGQTGEAKHECPTNMVDQPDPTQGIHDALVPSKRKRKHTHGAEAEPTKKRKKLNNNQNGATELDLSGDIPSVWSQGAVRPLSSHTQVLPLPVGRSAPWTPPVPTEHDKRAGVQVLKPAPASRFTSRESGKKGRSSVWHVWSEVRSCTRTNHGG